MKSEHGHGHGESDGHLDNTAWLIYWRNTKEDKAAGSGDSLMLRMALHPPTSLLATSSAPELASRLLFLLPASSVVLWTISIH
jgi:hypothetical protein